MRNLLSVLSSITPYGSERGFVELCWHQLSNVITSKEADTWSADKRDHFMVFANYFIINARAVFTVRDALLRERVSDLNDALLIELEESLDDLQEFAAATDFNELAETIDEYAEIIMCMEYSPLSITKIEFAACYIKIFFLTLHSLELKLRIQTTMSIANNKPLIYA